MNVRRLQIFLEVAESEGFARAADALDMSQPAVSQAIRELEDDLAVSLFHRLGRRIVLTSAGEALLQPARQILRDLELGREAVAQVAELLHGRLELACLPTLAVSPLAPLIGGFRSAYPGIKITLADPEDTEELLDFIRSGKAEIGLVETVHVPQLVTIDIGIQDFLIVLPPGTDVSPRVGLESLATMPLVATPRGTSTRRLLDESLRRAGIVANVVVEAGQREALLPLILAGAGAGLLPRPLAEVAGKLGCVVVESEPAVTRSIAMVHRDGPLTPAAERFVEMFAAINANRPKGIPWGG